ncbi:MAG: hypothetical protein HYS12_29945 [Planctomycetes bacterium]|nr:hypothetical protein [Planctomycetota bacterium]
MVFVFGTLTLAGECRTETAGQLAEEAVGFLGCCRKRTAIAEKQLAVSASMVNLGIVRAAFGAPRSRLDTSDVRISALWAFALASQRCTSSAEGFLEKATLRFFDDRAQGTGIAEESVRVASVIRRCVTSAALVTANSGHKNLPHVKEENCHYLVVRVAGRNPA